MKTLLVILMGLGMFFETQAQKGFKKIFDLDSIDNFSWSGTNYNGRYYVSNVSSTKTYFLEMYTLDVNGEFVEKNLSPFWFGYLYEPRFFVLDSAIYNYGMFQGKLNDTLYEDLIKGYVFKTNLKGDSIFFTNYFGKHTDFRIYKGVSLNHELYFAGVFAYNAMLLKIDTSGTFLWEKEWATENYFDGFEGLTSTRDTFLVGVGYTNGKGKDTTHTARNGLIVKMDTSGKVMWEQIINDPDDSLSSVFFEHCH